MADLDHDIAKAGDELERMGDKETEFKVTIKSVEEIATTNTTPMTRNHRIGLTLP